MKTSELARTSGVGTETVRYYERVGLLPVPERNEQGHRRWTEDHRRRLKFIRRAQGHGFQLDEIRELLALRVEESGVCEDVAETADRVIARIDSKLEELEQFRATLTALRKACRRGEPTVPCPILDAFGEKSEANN